MNKPLSTILLIDDDREMRQLIMHGLSSEDYHFVEADCGQAAIDQLANVKPDLVLLDVVMPGMDGFEVCEVIRARPDCKHVPILIMTSLEDVASIGRAYDAGATDFITKPINPTLLSHRLHFLLKTAVTARALRESEQRLATAQRIAKVGHFEWFFESDEIHWSTEICHILGLPLTETSMIHPNLISRVDPRDSDRVKASIRQSVREQSALSIEHRIVRPDGTIRTVLQEAEVFQDEEGKPLKMVGTLQDITSRRQAEDKIKTLAYYNNITGLPNRSLLKRLLNRRLSNRRNSQSLAVMTLSLDRYKLITDSYGHGFGESLIRKVAIKLIRAVKQSRIYDQQNYQDLFFQQRTERPVSIAHCGADEFVIVLPDIDEVDDAAMVARRLNKALAQPYTVSGQEIRITASIGISICPLDSANTDTLLKHSATALYHAKRQGGNAYKFYTEKMNAKAFQRLSLETNLRRAIEEKQFEIHYQPKLALASNELIGIEALLRWRHPELGLITPGEFINVTEETGLITNLGDWVFKSVCRQIKKWEKAGYQAIGVAVNLSTVQLQQKDCHLRLAKILNKTGVDPALIELEITESMLLNNMKQTIKMLKKLRSLGMQIALDDFGTGYSSLTYLKHFPVNTLKIDRSFIQHVTVDPDDASIVNGVIALAHSMGLKVVAEGIEEADQLRFLAASGCDYGQGYFFHTPVDAETFTPKFMRKPALQVVNR